MNVALNVFKIANKIQFYYLKLNSYIYIYIHIKHIHIYIILKIKKLMWIIKRFRNEGTKKFF